MRLPAKFLLMTGFFTLAAIGSAQPPAREKGKEGERPAVRPEGGRPGGEGDRRPEGGRPGAEGGRPGAGGMGRGMGQPGQILPPFLQEQLKLTEDQKKQLAELQKETEAKLDKLLTDDQRKVLKDMKERGPGGDRGRPGAEGGRPGGERRPGGEGDRRPGGERPPEKKQ